MKHWFVACVAVCALPSLPRVAAAQEAKMWEASLGARLLVGASHATTPSNLPPDYDGLGFAGNSGGWAWGVAAAGEVRFWKHLGVELSLGRDAARLQPRFRSGPPFERRGA
jgi:hypothetical protein